MRIVIDTKKLDFTSFENAQDVIKAFNAVNNAKIAELVERIPSLEPVACIAKVSFDEEKMKEMVDEAAKDIVEQCEDCISRESAKTAIREKFKDLPIRCEINEVLNGIPSVQPARPKGKWIIGDNEFNKIWGCCCSVCKKDPQYYISGSEDWWIDELPNFCPNCGADMKGE